MPGQGAAVAATLRIQSNEAGPRRNLADERRRQEQTHRRRSEFWRLISGDRKA